jgi:medium-chain acyl-[acyl-carrier-protein] hydrolase
MHLLSKVGCYPFLAEPFHCDFSQHLLMGHLGNHMLNAADFHSNDRGYGMNYLNPIHKTWVLSRLAVEMKEMPKAYDRFFVETWVDGAMRFFTSRNFAVKGEDDHVYGFGRSIWAMIDTDTRQPTDILQIHDGLIKEYLETEKVCPIAKPSRVQMTADAKLIRTIDTYYNDVDVNGHINSVKYIEHVLDLFPMEYYKTHFLQRFEMAYVAEAHCGDKLSFYREEKAENEYCIRIVKDDLETDKKIEIARSLAKFVNY